MPLTEWWYNTTYHTSTHTTPYEIVYGQPPPHHLPYLAGESKVVAVDKSMQAREAALKMVKFYLVRAQNRMKQQADRGRSDRQFAPGELVYVKLQPYRQSTVVNRKYLKLSAKFFGPFQILERIGVVAYKLDLPVESRIHPVFHVSQLKLHVGPLSKSTPLLMLIEEDVLAKEPVAVLDRRLGKKHGKAITKLLIHWKNSFPEDATWESLPHLLSQYPHFHP